MWTAQGVANRDLKLENLLLDRDGSDGTRPLLKICDFGVSKHVDDSTANTTVGTPVCMVSHPDTSANVTLEKGG